MNLLINPSVYNDSAQRFLMGSVFMLELLMICVGMFFCLIAIVVLSRTSQLHVNLTIILYVCAAQYLLGGSSRAFIITELWSHRVYIQAFRT
ncbi:unnamed protein product [Toxocara canis]|uniref:Uncharacterized protein n=1 Tax=Toxocara canis TaxID=6265 RepID=A0A183UIE5_TOXCA|nr:unnamed protein product [Toxocara canis]